MKLIDETFESRIDDVNWVNFATAYGEASIVGKQLKQLAFGEPKDAKNAAHELWCGLCHQHAYVSSASLPAFPFLIEVLQSTEKNLTVEILDIILGLTTCSIYDGKSGEKNNWGASLLEKLANELPLFQSLQSNNNEEIASFATNIVKRLQSKK